MNGYGATLGDAGIRLIDFAEHHPFRFLLTVPITLAFALALAALWLKIVVVGPLTNHKDRYEAARRRARDHDQERP